MAKKTSKDSKDKPLTERDIMKWEIAMELGLEQKVMQDGWSGLTAAESGRIGGILASRSKNKENAEKD